MEGRATTARILVILGYVLVFAVGGAIAWKIFTPLPQPEPTVNSLHFQAGEKLQMEDINFEVPSNDPLDEYDPWTNRPRVGQAQLPQQANEPPRVDRRPLPPVIGTSERQPLDHGGRLVGSSDGIRRSLSSGCRPCTARTYSGPANGAPPLPPEQNHIPESVGTKRTTLPITSQP